MRLAQFIQTKTEHLFEDWEDAELQMAPEFHGADRSAFRDHARSMLGAISESLFSSPPVDEFEGKPLLRTRQMTQDLSSLRGLLNWTRTRQQREPGAKYAQGFLFSSPLCQKDFEVLLRRDRQEQARYHVTKV